MAVTANSAITAQGLKTKNCVCTAAKTTYNDAANAELLCSAGPNGSILYGLSAIPRATVTATQLQLYRSPDGGVTLNLISTQIMGAYTMAQTTQAPKISFEWTETAPLRLGPGDSLYAGIGVALAGGIVFDATAEDL
jgi:hypothetical protein